MAIISTKMIKNAKNGKNIIKIVKMEMIIHV
jgi:hypothetical protein